MSESGHSQPAFANSWNKKKKRFRDREFVRDQEYNHDGQSFGSSRHDSGRSVISKDNSEDIDKNKLSLSQTNTKPPVILAKPAKSLSSSSSVSETSKTGSWKEVSMSPTTPVAPQISMTVGRSLHNRDQSSSEKKNSITRSSSDSKFRNSTSPNLKQGLSQAGINSNTNLSTSSTTKSKEGNSRSSSKMLDSSLHWVEGGIELLQDQSDFMVIGVIGMQGVGKSTILSIIAGNKFDDLPKNYLFKQQTPEVKERVSHMTCGIDMAITNERIILLDTQPILSASLLEQSIHYDRKSTAEYNGTSNIEIQSLQMTAFLLTVCHIVIVVQDWFTDGNIYKFLQTAEMLKPVTTPPSHDTNSASEHDPAHIQPVIVFVHNKIDAEMFNIRTITAMNEVMRNMVKFSSVHCHGHFSLIESNLFPGLSSISVGNEINSFLLPNVNDNKNQEEKCDVEKVTYDLADQQFLSLQPYVGRPSTSLLETTFRKMMLSIPRHQLTHLPLTEKNWFHYAARTWETIRKSQLVSEYNRLISG